MEHTKSVYMCGLCRQPYRDPRLLPCLHAFCFDCLQKQLDDSTDQQASLSCPTCFEQIALSIQDLPRHVYLGNQANTVRRLSEFRTARNCENCDSKEKACAFCHDCGDCGLQICKQCLECHKRFRSYKKHTVVSLDSNPEEVFREIYGKEDRMCAKHSDKVLKYFCKSCEALVCSKCILFDHSSHKYQIIKSILDEQKNEVQSACSMLKQALPRITHADSDVKDVMKKVDKRNTEIKREIEEAFSAIIAAAERRKHELLMEAEAIAVAKKTQLQIQQEGLEKLHTAVTLALDTIQHGTQSYSSVEFLSIKAVLKQSCLNLEKRFTNTSLTPVASPSMVASVNTVDTITAIGSVGSVVERLPCSPSHSGLVGINMKFPIGITKDAKRILIVQTRNSRGDPMDTGGISVRAWLTDQSGRRLSDAEVSDSDNGKYNVTFCVQESCLGKAHFTVNGNHIDGSPCDVIVRDYTKVQKPKLSFNTPSNPAYLHVSHGNGDIFVTLDNGNVCVYSSKGGLKSTISGTNLGIECARGIVVDGEREVMYIACARRNKIVKATLDGKLISSVGRRGSSHLRFNWPMGICQDTSGNIYVADSDNKRVQILGPDLVFKNELKCRERVWGVAVDSLGNVHIATESGMKIFASEVGYGTKRWGDVVVSQEDYRVVTCFEDDGSLTVFKPNNSLLRTICGLKQPLGICLDQSGNIFVAEYNANKVHKY